MKLSLLILAALVMSAACMTVSVHEEAELPEELKPIVPGGSWFDDMAVERLKKKHEELKELGHLDSHEHTDDSEEMFIMARMGSHKIVKLPDGDKTDHHLHHQNESPVDEQNTRDAMRSFLRNHGLHKEEAVHHLDHHHDEDDESGASLESHASKEFMQVYERELKKFFKNFMSAMLHAEVGGVSIENRSEEEKEAPAGKSQRAGFVLNGAA